MEFVGGKHGPLHRDIARQVGIGATHPGVGVAVEFGVKVHHLHDAVHAGIGAACTQSGNALGSKLAQRGFQFVLDGLARELALPALVGLSVVADA